MAGLEKNLDVHWFGQKTLFFCGPAVAQMFLDYVKVTATQEDLWTDIKSKSGGTRPADAPKSDHAFPEQVCDTCDPASTDPDRWLCWDTTPEALSATVAGRGNVALGARYAATFVPGVEMLIDSLDLTPDAPAFATTYLFNHWILVTGYIRDDFASTTAPIMTVGRYNLNGFYIRDPFDREGVDHVRFVPAGAWQQQFGLVACGPHIDTYPIVIRTVAMAAWVRFVLIVVLALSAFWLWSLYVGN